MGGGVAYVTFSNGYVAFSVSNPSAPRQLADARGPFFIWRHVVHDGSRYAITPVGGTTPGLSRYLLTNAVLPAVFETTIEAPGALNAVSLYNGAAYLAAGERGLHVVNYREIDTGRQPPVGVLRTSVTNGVVTEGQRIVLRADVQDDVQLRNVQFLVNGAPYLVDGSFPFEVGWRAPVGSAGSTVTLAATAIDTGGNETNLSPVTVSIVPDRVAPVVVIDGPATDVVFTVGDDIIVKAGLFDAIGVDFGTVEILVDGEAVPSRRLGAGTWAIVSPSTLGTHTLGLRAWDYAGNLGAASAVRFTVIREAISAELTLAVLERAPEAQEAISRELTITVLTPATQPSTTPDRETGDIRPSTNSESPKP